VRESFRHLGVNGETYRSKRSGKKAAEKDNYIFYYNRPTLIIVSNDKEPSNCVADSAIALESILPAAPSLELIACFVNQLI
jgi:hypothetical protein